jgi:hypothetical protein
MGGTEGRINFEAPAVLRKWPSHQRSEGAAPYLLVDDTLYESLREFLTKPTTARHLYEIHTAPQPPLVSCPESTSSSLPIAGFSLI